ncbi:MAG: site-specific DNA-methyltransferase [Blastocatellia bacterium]|nr:site-specific DNA-methyltransferase [Blastocatellia bacterium]
MIQQACLKWIDKYFDTQLFISKNAPKPYYLSATGALYSADCLEILPYVETEVIDTVFADPPFNLGKIYGRNSNDSLNDKEYIEWCYKWLNECIRILKPGGSLFVYNLPKWNIILGSFLIQNGLQFRHWIAVEMNTSLPISGKLYPSHYGLLYFSKGKPNTSKRIRTPIEVCRHCGGETKDYGGHRNAMNPNGVTLKDVWTDIPPVRHSKYKIKDRKANVLSTKILDRVIETSTLPGDIVLDPFGGSGTTFAVCESKQRNWIGIEIDFADQIVSRLESNSIKHHKNSDFVED